MLEQLDIAANQLSVGAIEPVCLLLGGCPMLRVLDMRLNPLGAPKAVMTSLVSQGAPSAASAFDALQALPGMLHSLPAVIRAGSKAKDLLIGVLTSATICELRLDPTLLSAREAAQLQHKLLKNREQAQLQQEHFDIGADAPPTSLPSSRTSSFARRGRRQLSWGRAPQASRVGPPAEMPVLGVLFSAPLACVDAGGNVVPMDTLDFDKERQLICDSMREAKRALRLRFEHATTDRLRTLVTLGCCVGLHYSGHGDPAFLSMEDGRGAAHFVGVEKLRKLLQAGGDTQLQFVFVSACFSEAAALAFVEAGVPHVVAVRRTTRVSDLAAHAFTRAFYLALAVGSSIQAAYDIGKQAVFTAPNMPEADESSSFLLLPRDAAHDVVVLPSLPRVEHWEPPASLGAQRQPLPAPTEAFRGRNVESYRVVSAILDRRLVTISGEPGVGKSCVAVFALNYLAERHYFSDGVIHVEASGCDSIGALALALDGAIVAAFGTPSHADPAALLEAGPSVPGSEGGQGSEGGGASRDSEGGGLQERQRRSSGGGSGQEMMAPVVAPLHMLHCLLVLDGVATELLHQPAFLWLLGALLSFARVRTLLTARQPVASPLQGGAEKVIELAPLSSLNTARLLCRLSPRTLRLHELPGASNAADFVQLLARTPLVRMLSGNPGRVKATAPRLQTLSLDELGRSLAAEAAPVHAPAAVT